MDVEKHPPRAPRAATEQTPTHPTKHLFSTLIQTFLPTPHTSFGGAPCPCASPCTPNRGARTFPRAARSQLAPVREGRSAGRQSVLSPTTCRGRASEDLAVHAACGSYASGPSPLRATLPRRHSMSSVCSQHASAPNMRHAHDTVRLEQIRHGQTGIVAPVPYSAQAARRARSLLSLSSVSNAMTGAHAMPRLLAFAVLSLKRSLARAAASAISSPNVGTSQPQAPSSPRLQRTPASAPSRSTCPECSSAPLFAAGPPPRQKFQSYVFFLNPIKFQ